MMKTYHVTIRRTLRQTYDLEIEAENEDEAFEQADDEILNISEDDWEGDITESDPEVAKVIELADAPAE